MCLFRKKKQEPVQPLPVEELLANIDMLKEQFLLVKGDVVNKDDELLEVEAKLAEANAENDRKDERIQMLEEKVKHLEEVLDKINNLVDGK